MNSNKRKVVLNIINSKKDKVIIPEVVHKVEIKVEAPSVKEDLPIALKDLETPEQSVQEVVVEQATVTETVKSKKNKKTVESEEQK